MRVLIDVLYRSSTSRQFVGCYREILAKFRLEPTEGAAASSTRRPAAEPCSVAMAMAGAERPRKALNSAVSCFWVVSWLVACAWSGTGQSWKPLGGRRVHFPTDPLSLLCGSLPTTLSRCCHLHHPKLRHRASGRYHSNGRPNGRFPNFGS